MTRPLFETMVERINNCTKNLTRGY
uniref:Uncharacterized protein n=1 Tax=Rhizophora mucronata TaxID=61149 RepID=A0A2P2NFH8_RHIMU